MSALSLQLVTCNFVFAIAAYENLIKWSHMWWRTSKADDILPSFSFSFHWIILCWSKLNSETLSRNRQNSIQSVQKMKIGSKMLIMFLINIFANPYLCCLYHNSFVDIISGLGTDCFWLFVFFWGGVLFFLFLFFSFTLFP